jgi:hypothetical protein
MGRGSWAERCGGGPGKQERDCWAKSAEMGQGEDKLGGGGWLGLFPISFLSLFSLLPTTPNLIQY